MIEKLKEKIEQFRASKRGVYRDEYNPELNFWNLKSESLKYSNKTQYIDVCSDISCWLLEHESTLTTYQLTDIMILGNDVYLYTKRPGLWIGKGGSTLESVEHRINYNLDGKQISDYKVHIIEDKDSIFNMISTTTYY